MRRVLLFVAVLVAACSGGGDTAETFTTAVDQSVEQPADAVPGDVAEDVEVVEPADSESADSEDTTAVPATTETSSSLPPTTEAASTTRAPATTTASPTTRAPAPTGPVKVDDTTLTLAPEHQDTDTHGADTDPPSEPVEAEVGQVTEDPWGIKKTKISVEHGPADTSKCNGIPLDAGEKCVCSLVEYPPEAEVEPFETCGLRG